MGLRAEFHEGQISITDGGTVVESYFLPNWKANIEAVLKESGEDYLEYLQTPFRSMESTLINLQI